MCLLPALWQQCALRSAAACAQQHRWPHVVVVAAAATAKLNFLHYFPGSGASSGKESIAAASAVIVGRGGKRSSRRDRRGKTTAAIPICHRCRRVGVCIAAVTTPTSGFLGAAAIAVVFAGSSRVGEAHTLVFPVEDGVELLHKQVAQDPQRPGKRMKRCCGGDQGRVRRRGQSRGSSTVVLVVWAVCAPSSSPHGDTDHTPRSARHTRDTDRHTDTQDTHSTCTKPSHHKPHVIRVRLPAWRWDVERHEAGLAQLHHVRAKKVRRVRTHGLPRLGADLPDQAIDRTANIINNWIHAADAR